MLNFIKQFISNPQEVGAIFPTGNILSKVIVETANLKDTKSIVEFGPGTGVFTREILNKINPNSIFFTIESNLDFFQKMKKDFSNTTTYHDSAVSIRKYLDENNIKACDRIISGLPWAAFGEKLQTEILQKAYLSLSPNGIFVTFSYIHSPLLPSGIKFKKLLEKTFKKVEKSNIVWKNLPPAFVYKCTK
ncbi:MAG: rRNA adenine N-6-methyltransferase family protein [bacterium]